MTESQWQTFCGFKNRYKQKIMEWTDSVPELQALQKQAAAAQKTPLYDFETPVVYNRALDDVEPEDEIKLIVIGDNPGKEEQLARNNRYLVGQAGRIAEGYFRRNSGLGIDFRRDAIILNKTPVHSAKTAQLRLMAKLGGKKVTELLEESQKWCAQETARLHCALCAEAPAGGRLPELWLVGYSELKKNGMFEVYREELKRCYQEQEGGFHAAWENVFVFQHFSMNRFTIDLGEYIKKNDCGTQPLGEVIRSLGRIHKKEIFG